MKKIVLGIFLSLALFGFAGRVSAVQSDGKEDTNFYNNLGSAFGDTGTSIFAIAVEPDGDILVGGNFTTFNGNPRKNIVRIKNDGTEDTNFYNNLGYDFDGEVYSIALQSDGKILVGGRFTYINNKSVNLVRLNSNGTADTSFYNNLGSGVAGQVYDVAVQSDGKILATGLISSFNGIPRKGLIRVNSNGTEDTTFANSLGTGFNGTVRKIALQSDGKIITGGTFSTFNGNSREGIVRLNSNGTEDSQFYTNIGSGFDLQIYSILIQPNGQILLGGLFNNLNNSFFSPLLRLNSNGTPDTAFTSAISNQAYSPFPNFDDFITALNVDSSGDIYVGGKFKNFKGASRNGIVRLNSNGTEDENFYNALGNGFYHSSGDAIVEYIAVDSNDKVLIGGNFTSFKNNPRNKLVRLTCCNLPPTVILSATPSNVTTGGATNLTWTVENANTCTASGGWTGSKSINGGSQIIGNLQTNTVFTLTCVGDGGTVASSQTVTVTTGLPVVNLSALPLAIPQGGTTKLTWSSTNATSCTASAIPSNSAWTGPKNPAGSFKNITNLQIDTTFKLSCTGDGGTSEASVSVTVAPKPSIIFNADPTIVNYNGNTTLNWTVTNATSCTASGGWTGNKNAISGSEVRSNLTANTTFTLACTGPGGNNQASVIVTVNSPNPTITLTASPTNVTYGGYTSLTWSSTNTTSCAASGGWTGNKSSSGSQPILTPLTADTTFNLSCTGPGGTSNASVTVTVNPIAPTVTLTLDPISISIPGSVNLTWTSSNATSCTASSTPNTTWTGTRPLNSTESEKVQNINQDTEFVLSCTGLGGTTESRVNLTTVPLPTVSLSINKTEILPGQNVTLTWNVNNADACIATSSPNNNDWNGNQAFSNGIHTKVINNIQNDTNFNIVCNNQAGTDNDSVSIKLIAEKLTFNNTKVLYDINSKQYKTKLSWVAVNVKDCVASTNSDDGEVKNSWTGNKLSSPSPYQGETQNVIVKSVLPEVTKYTLTCSGIHSNKIITLSKDLHTASLASSGVGIPDYEEN